MIACRFAIIALLSIATAAHGAATQFCLDGEYDLGTRFQGLQPGPGEFYPARWCVISEDESDRVHLSIQGESNPDIDGSWEVAFLPPDLVRIVNSESPPDIEFRTGKSAGEAQRTRRMDPRRVVEELIDGDSRGFDAQIVDGRLVTLATFADLPLRGRVHVTWHWNWENPDSPVLELTVDSDTVFRGTGSWRVVDDAASLWRATTGAEPVDVPGENWPSRVAMELETLSEHVYLVRNVRTGFHHLLVDTDDGLIVADAPAGWVELFQVPPTDLVPGLGISGLSEMLLDFLAEEFPDKPLRAVVLTHHHDDHAGGARAFAAAGAEVYAPGPVADFLESALNRDSMPADRLAAIDSQVSVKPLTETLRVADDPVSVDLVAIGPSPHALASVGVLADSWFFQSDLHVPNSEEGFPAAHRLATECWFARWAVDNLPENAVVLSVHSSIRTPVSRLNEYLQTPDCLRRYRRE